VTITRRQVELDRFWARVDKSGPNGCWLWLGNTDTPGYGRCNYLHDGKRVRLAHRLAYLLTVGPIPDGLELDHLCRVHGCVNPAHLEPVTHAENVRRAVMATGERSRMGRRSHCDAGHPFDESNTIKRGPDGRWRRCLTCERARWRLNYDKPLNAARQRVSRRSLRGTPPPTHGRRGYSVYACRCEVCREANTVHARKMRALKRLREAS
jgi:hypothetical protein